MGRTLVVTLTVSDVGRALVVTNESDMESLLIVTLTVSLEWGEHYL